MRGEHGRSWWRLGLCVILIVIAAIVTVAVCHSSRVRVIPPGEATEAQVQAAIGELREFLRDAGRSQAEIDRMVKELRCRYLPESTERCSNAESREAEKER